MRTQILTNAFRVLAVAEGVFAATIMGIMWFRIPRCNTLVDVIFLEGGILIAAGGLIDGFRSITLTRIRGIGKHRPLDPPPAVRKPGIGYLLLSAGILLCLQALLLLYFFSSHPGPQPGKP